MEMQILPPANRQTRHFEKFIQALIHKFKPQQIFCFGEIITSEESKGCFKTTETDQNCDYCLLMVTESATRITHDVQDFANHRYKMGKITFLCHDRQTVLAAIRKNSRFFITVCKSAKLIYSNDGTNPFDPNIEFIPAQAATKAKEHFNHRISVAEGFLQGAQACFNSKQYTVCTFLLHQVVEQCCIALLRVNIGYRSEIHNLYRMLGICKSFSELPFQLFLSGGADNQRRFDLLAKSYCSARYEMDFSVPAEDATFILQHVLSFLELTKKLCTSQIKKLDRETKSHQLLHDPIISDKHLNETPDEDPELCSSFSGSLMNAVADYPIDQEPT